MDCLRTSHGKRTHQTALRVSDEPLESEFQFCPQCYIILLLTQVETRRHQQDVFLPIVSPTHRFSLQSCFFLVAKVEHSAPIPPAILPARRCTKKPDAAVSESSGKQWSASWRFVWRHDKRQTGGYSNRGIVSGAAEARIVSASMVLLGSS